MFIRSTEDGRVFGGTAVEIVESMRGEAFTTSRTVGEYVDELVASVKRLRGVDLEVGDGCDADKAERFVDAMVDAGLFEHAD